MSLKKPTANFILQLIEKYTALYQQQGFVPVELLIESFSNYNEKSLIDFCDSLFERGIVVKVSSTEAKLTISEIIDIKEAEESLSLLLPKSGYKVTSQDFNKILDKEVEFEFAYSMKKSFDDALMIALEFKVFEDTLHQILGNIIYHNDRIWKYFEDPRTEENHDIDTTEIITQLMDFKNFLQKKSDKIEELYRLKIAAEKAKDKKAIHNLKKRIKRARERRIEVFEQFTFIPRIEFLDFISLKIKKYFNLNSSLSDETCLDIFGISSSAFLDLAENFIKYENQFHYARERLILSNQKLVGFFARKYKDQGVEIVDLIGEGNIGLLRAVERFDPSKGSRLATYATWWIKHNLNRAVSKQGSTIRIPGHIREEKSRILKVKKELTLKNNSVPSNEEIANYLDLPPQKVSSILQNTQSSISMDKPIGKDESDDTLQKIIPDLNTEDPETIVERSKKHKILNQLMDGLSSRERHILEMRYGLINSIPMTLQEVGTVLHITRERVRQLQTKAERKLLKLAKQYGFKFIL